MCGLLWKTLADPTSGQPIEDAELALAQALIDERSSWPAGKRSLPADDPGGLLCPDIRRGKDDLWPLIARERGKPAAGGPGLLDTELGQGDVDVSHFDPDFVSAGLMRRVARDIPLALAVTHDPEPLRPVVPHQQFSLGGSKHEHQDCANARILGLERALLGRDRGLLQLPLLDPPEGR